MNFIGEKCVACGIEFKNGDDIVVCPECGSPHHRACYKVMNSCANSALHGTDECWHSSSETGPEDKPEKKKFVICPACHFPNALAEENCIRCGYSLADADGESEDDTEAGFGIPRPYLGFNPDIRTRIWEDLRSGASLISSARILFIISRYSSV